MIPEIGLVLDAGTGLFRVREYLQTQSLDIFLSHVHLDHSIGITFLFDVLYKKKTDKVTVHAEADKLAAIQQHLLSPLLFPVQPPCEFAALKAKPYRLQQGGRLTYFPLKHPGGSVGYRIDFPNFSLAYVTDTTASEQADYIQKIQGVDLLIHECYFPDGWESQAELTGHSCVTPVAQVARKAKVGRLVLVHINPIIENDDKLGVAAAKKIFAEIEIAVDGLCIEFEP
jgi:ribonuclease BN (tRNA processing enzyme)